jgi:hypothetical protein
MAFGVSRGWQRAAMMQRAAPQLVRQTGHMHRGAWPSSNLGHGLISEMAVLTFRLDTYSAMVPDAASLVTLQLVASAPVKSGRATPGGRSAGRGAGRGRARTGGGEEHGEEVVRGALRRWHEGEAEHVVRSVLDPRPPGAAVQRVPCGVTRALLGVRQTAPAGAALDPARTPAAALGRSRPIRRASNKHGLAAPSCAAARRAAPHLRPARTSDAARVQARAARAP